MSRPSPFSRSAFFATRSVIAVSLLAASLAFSGCSAPPAIVAPAPDEPAAVVAPVVALPPMAEAVVPKIETRPIDAVSEDNTIFFPLRSAMVDDVGKEKLRWHADRLKESKKTCVTLAGYGDDLGSRSYNLAIAEERLVAVSQVLRGYGVSPRQIRRSRVGSVKQATVCASADCRQRRRRVELFYFP